MRQQWVIFVIGLIVLFLPFLGFPKTFDNVVYVLSGLVIVVLTLRNLRKSYVKQLYNGGEGKE